MGTWFETATFACVKAGNDPHHYEDHAACSSPHGMPSRPGRFAVADGATVSVFAKAWAMALAEAFVSSRRKEWQDHGWLARARRRWSELVLAQPLPWNVAVKVQAGAYAALAGLHLARPHAGRSSGRYAMLAVGDTCVFQVRDQTLYRAFPLDRPDLFGSTPELLCSVPHPERSEPLIRSTRGTYRPGDLFLLMSDAIAVWFLQEVAKLRQPWRSFEPGGHLAQDPAAFAAFVEDLRTANLLKNDDVTVLTVRLDGG